MTKIIKPKERKLDETEEIVLPHVKCDSCQNWTQTGLHQKRLIMVKPGQVKKINGQWTRTPPVMKRVDAYMCTNCVKEGRKWPGENPR